MSSNRPFSGNKEPKSTSAPLSRHPLKRLGWGLAALAFFSHTLLLGLRILILSRPPVANMAETLLYVPWIIALLGSVYAWIKRDRQVLLATLGSSWLFLSLFSLFQISASYENVPPVLDSQFWLTVHVLCVVASYGAFALGSVLAHFTLFRPSAELHRPIQASLYTGLFLLLSGTLLGGVWAAQSWGRFWDWDPKESWAFLSCCTYLGLIHLYRYKKISERAFAFGAIIGFLVISFTWYGVNYILVTGLHSYGFGSGGERFYFLFLLFEALFMFVAFSYQKILSRRL